jgi:Tol biopolymer transport system component
LYRVAFKSANLLKVSLVTTAAMLAICLLALVAPPNTAEADDSNTEEAGDSRRYNGKIAFNHDGALYTVEPDGSTPRQLINDTYMVDRPAWSPDGTKIAFGHTQREGSKFSAISVMNADGSDLRHLRTTTIRSSLAPTWLPDGTKLAFHADLPSTQGYMDIFVMDPDGSNLVNVTGIGTSPGGQSELGAAFSPDGSQMCVLLPTGFWETNSPPGIYVMDADGSDPTLLVKESLDALSGGVHKRCTWSPDGTKIAFSLSPSHEVFVINADGSAMTNLTSNSASDALPDWSPDGKKIAFNSDRDGNFDIYTMDPDGSDIAQVTNLPGDDYAPDW